LAQDKFVRQAALCARQGVDVATIALAKSSPAGSKSWIVTKRDYGHGRRQLRHGRHRVHRGRHRVHHGRHGWQHGRHGWHGWQHGRHELMVCGGRSLGDESVSWNHFFSPLPSVPVGRRVTPPPRVPAHRRDGRSVSSCPTRSARVHRRPPRSRSRRG